MNHEGVFLAFLANVNCRVSRASGDSALDLLGGGGGSKRPQILAAGRSLHVCLQHNFRTSCDLQIIDSGKAYQFDEKTQGKLRATPGH